MTQALTHDTLKLIALEIPDKETMKSFGEACQLTNRIYYELKNEWYRYCNHNCLDLLHIRLKFLSSYDANIPLNANDIDIHCHCCKSSQLFYKFFDY